MEWKFELPNGSYSVSEVILNIYYKKHRDIAWI